MALVATFSLMYRQLRVQSHANVIGVIVLVKVPELANVDCLMKAGGSDGLRPRLGSIRSTSFSLLYATGHMQCKFCARKTRLVRSSPWD